MQWQVWKFQVKNLNNKAWIHELFRRDVINVHEYLKDKCQMDGSRLLSVVLSNRIKGNGHKLKHRKFHRNMRENIPVTEH